MNSVDFPEFGFPIIEIAFLFFKTPFISLPENLIKLSNNSSVPILWYPEIKVSRNKFHNIKNNLKIKYNNYITRNNLDTVKYKCNMVTEALQEVCELFK